MLPFDFIIAGPPVSQQTRRSNRLREWKDQVRAQAAAVWPPGAAPVSGALSVQVVYYYDGEPLDVDNMVKPISDAFGGLVYEDDNQVTDLGAHKRSLNGSFRVRGMSPQLARGFSSGREFLYVRVQEPPDPEDLV